MKEKFWQRLAHRMKLSRLLDDPRFRTFADRMQYRDELVPLLKRVMQTKTTAEWLEILRGHVPCAPVYTVEEALQDEQVVARDMVIEVEHPQFGSLREVGCPIKIEGVQPRYTAGARLGADTDDLLRSWLRMSPDDIRALRDQGAI
jgi:crotonobetainyl-CoA:carnitine CoA-transferase CaiB-like acyl-CoA transferase